MPTFAENRKARFDYEILESFPAGIELFGSEVKSVRAGKISLAGSFVIIRGREAFLQGAKIEPYQPNNEASDQEPERPIKLLLRKDEIEKLEKADSSKGLTIVPIKVYNNGRFLKLELAIVRGKKQFDKRQTIKKRDVERDLKKDF
ncbi:MAG: SsrA-binding protein SsrA-binding protein [Parcubacteria group bacterium]|nr:SsrA-binding protein SsrA-binding protein [Parcubacteria group bacterium]